MPAPAAEPRLSVVAENVGSTDDGDPEFLRSPIDEAKLSSRLKQLGEDAASHREAAELAQRTLEQLAMTALELRARAISGAWREVEFRSRALDRREEQINLRARELDKQRAALDGLRSALGLAASQ